MNPRYIIVSFKKIELFIKSITSKISDLNRNYALRKQNTDDEYQHRSDDLKISVLLKKIANLFGDFKMSGAESADLSLSIKPHKMLIYSIFIRFIK